MPVFRKAVIEQTITVQVGYMLRPMAVAAISREDGLFIHVAGDEDWMCRAISGLGKNASPLKGTTFWKRLSQCCEFIGGTEPDSALAEDPMDELQAQPLPSLETPKKRSRRRLTTAEHDFIIKVPLRSLVDDLSLFQGEDRTVVERGDIRFLVKTNRRRSSYVIDKDIDTLMLVLARMRERMGVPHGDLPDASSALADASEWFDSVASCWHVRVPNSEEILKSGPVRRYGGGGRPLTPEEFSARKGQALDQLKASLPG